MKAPVATASHEAQVAETEELLREYLADIALMRERGEDVWHRRKNHRILSQVRVAHRALQARFVACALREAIAALNAQPHRRAGYFDGSPECERRDDCQRACEGLLARALPFTQAELCLLVKAQLDDILAWLCTPGQVLKQFEHALRNQPPTPKLQKLLHKWRADFRTYYRDDRAKLEYRFDQLLGRDDSQAPAQSRPSCPGSELQAFLAGEARRAAGLVHTGRPHVMRMVVAPDAIAALSPRQQAALLCQMATEIGPTVHIARFALDRPAFTSIRTLAPELSGIAEQLLLAIAECSDRELFGWTVTGRPGRAPFHTFWDNDWLVPEALYLANLARPQFIQRCREQILRQNDGWDSAWWGRHLDPLEDEAGRPYEFFFRPHDACADAAITDLRRLGPQRCQQWLSLLEHCDASDFSRPTATWSKRARELVMALPQREVERLLGWFTLVGRPGARDRNLYGWPYDPTVLRDGNARLLRGLIFAAAHRPSPDLAAGLGDLALACEQPVLHLGPRCAIVRNAALAALSLMPVEVAGPQLGRLSQMLKYKTSRRLEGNATTRAAARSGLTKDEFIERAVPDYALSAKGERRIPIGKAAATLRICGAAVSTTWCLNGQESPQPPDAILKRYTHEVRRVQRLAKEIGSMLLAQRLRLERLLASDRRWPQDLFLRQFVEHPLIGPMCCRLIWTIDNAGERTSAMRDDQAWRDFRGKQLRVPPEALIRPWHPASNPQEVVAWRRRLEAGDMPQPFKQAHREVYLLTDAERATGTYSNRFAAHIIRASQFARLLRERGWQGTPASAFDNNSPASIDLPHADLRITLVTQPLDPDEEGARYTLLSTDRLAVASLSTGDAVALETLHPAILSEVMRDADLFISVCSVGNDPHWSDAGPLPALREYWWSYGFGDLSETGAGRRDLLQRLIPRLAIADRCSIDGRYLRVKGNIRTYKIHLGSGNILMEPNDQYLCIVPSSRDIAAGAGPVFLPFEGDRTLSIILSKAFLLADDDKITDPTIVQQIKAR